MFFQVMKKFLQISFVQLRFTMTADPCVVKGASVLNGVWTSRDLSWFPGIRFPFLENSS